MVESTTSISILMKTPQSVEDCHATLFMKWVKSRMCPLSRNNAMNRVWAVTDMRRAGAGNLPRNLGEFLIWYLLRSTTTAAHSLYNSITCVGGPCFVLWDELSRWWERLRRFVFHYWASARRSLHTWNLIPCCVSISVGISCNLCT